MEEDIRWKQRFENLDKALVVLGECVDAINKDSENKLLKIALVGAFQFIFELSWKTLKDFLDYKGITVSLPKDVIKSAFQHKLIKNGEIWISMLQDRNMMDHLYTEENTEKAIQRILDEYYKELLEVHRFLKGHL